MAGRVACVGAQAGGLIIMLENIAMWSFVGALYAFACSMLIGISIAMVCAPWPAKAIFIPLFLAVLGMWVFLTIMVGARMLEEDAVRAAIANIKKYVGALTRTQI